MGIIVIIFFLCLSALIQYSANQKPDIYSLHIQSDVKYRFSTTLITSRVVNPYNTSTEARFDVFLPDDAFISNFTMEIDGVIYSGTVKEKEQAKRQYQRAKKRGQSAGLISKKPREANRFKVDINIAAHGKVIFNLTYQELLERKKGFYQHTIFVNPGQVVDDMQIEVAVRESREITSVDAMTKVLSNDVYTDYTNAGVAIITQPDPQRAFIKYFPSIDEQRQYSDEGFSGQFVVRYDIDRELDAGDILVVNGYFVHFFAPEVKDRLPRDVIFVIDTSGSMGGRKMDQVKAALRKILVDLLEGERFNIMTFSSGGNDQKWFKEDMVYVTTENIREAHSFVESIAAYGGTNIHAALINGIEKLSEKHDPERSLALLFLTDGQANSGLTRTEDILASVKQENDIDIPMFSLAFGQNADWKLVQKISDENNGFARKIYEDSDAALQIAGFYDELAVTLMKDVEIKYLDDAVAEDSLTKSDYRNYYQGSELVVAGKLEDENTRHLNLEILGNSADGNIVLTASADDVASDFSDDSGQTKLEDFQEITEKTWAYLTIKQLLEKSEVTDNITIKSEMKERALELSLKYNFVTPLTSMVVTKPEKKERNDTDATLPEEKDEPKPLPSSGLRGPPGRSGAQSAGQADSDPHFIVKAKGLNNAICFDVMGEEGDVYQLVKDEYSGLVVNAKVVANKPNPRKVNTRRSGEIKTFLGEITIKRTGFITIVSPLKLEVNGEPLEWTNGTTVSQENTRIVVDNSSNTVTVFFNDQIALLVMRHLKSKSLLRAGKVNFLGFYILDFKGLSFHTHGLLGQFLHRTVLLTKTKDRNGKLMGRLGVSGNTARPRKLMATLGRRLNLATNTTVPCWMVQHNGGALLDGVVTDYLLVRGKPKSNGQIQGA